MIKSIEFSDAIKYNLYLIEKRMHSIELEIQAIQDDLSEVINDDEVDVEKLYEVVSSISEQSSSLEDFIDNELIEKYFGW